MKRYRLLVTLMALLAAACNSGTAAETPTGAYKRYIEASRKQDVAAMKSLLSEGSIKQLDDTAKKEKLTVDDILRKETAIEIKHAPETRGEKIEGDAATVEVTNEATGRTETWQFVREGGAWKLARDKYLEQIRRADAGRS